MLAVTPFCLDLGVSGETLDVLSMLAHAGNTYEKAVVRGKDKLDKI